MKFYLVALSVSCLAVVSCKKERTCSCTVTNSGSYNTHTKTATILSAPITLTLDIGLPIPLPPIEFPPIVIATGKDTTIVTPYSWSNTSKANYDKVSKGAMKKNCPNSVNETVTDQFTTIVPGTSTVTTIQAGTKVSACKIE